MDFAKIQSQYQRLPEDVKDVLFSTHTVLEVERIIEQFSLPRERIEKLYELLTSMLIGLSHPRFLKDRLRGELALDEATSVGLSREVERAILDPVRESLEALYETPPVIGITQTPPEIETQIATSLPPIGQRIKDEIIAEVRKTKETEVKLLDLLRKEIEITTN